MSLCHVQLAAVALCVGSLASAGEPVTSLPQHVTTHDRNSQASDLSWAQFEASGSSQRAAPRAIAAIHSPALAGSGCNAVAANDALLILAMVLAYFLPKPPRRRRVRVKR